MPVPPMPQNTQCATVVVSITVSDTMPLPGVTPGAELTSRCRNSDLSQPPSRANIAESGAFAAPANVRHRWRAETSRHDAPAFHSNRCPDPSCRIVELAPSPVRSSRSAESISTGG